MSFRTHILVTYELKYEFWEFCHGDGSQTRTRFTIRARHEKWTSCRNQRTTKIRHFPSHVYILLSAVYLLR